MMTIEARWLRRVVAAAVVVVTLGACATGPSRAGRAFPSAAGENAARPLTIGVIGDMPYTPTQLGGFARFVDALSADRSFDVVIHLGDIKGGSDPCTDAYLERIRDALNSYRGAFVYTPGDNEWTDCHATDTGPTNPVERLRVLRQKFFHEPGVTLGSTRRQVLTQGGSVDFPAFVENQAWIQSGIVLAVVHMPGSNNGRDSWRSGVGTRIQQQEEFDTRLAADLEWLENVFALARKRQARAVVLGTQADMWDANAQLTGYTRIVRKLASLVRGFGKPVLLLNGDSHRFKVDNPLASGDAQHWVLRAVPNLTRITVNGGRDHPLEYLRLTIDPDQQHAPFAWTRVAPPLTP